MRRWIEITESQNAPNTLADVARHFLYMHDDLLDDDEDLPEEMDEKTALEIIQREYVSGTCGAFAIALHDKLGYPIVGMNGGMHIAVRAPDGEIVDFMGKSPLAKVLRRYGMTVRDTPIQEWSREETVEHVLMNEDESDDPWDEIQIAKWVMNKLGRW